jgi:hypothetical protein
MAINFPLSLDFLSNPASGNKLDSPSHSTQHGDANDILEALETKLGIGASPAGSATAGFPLVHSTGGTTAWAQVGYQGITSGTATSGQVLTAGTATGTSTWSTPTASGLVLLNTQAFSAVSNQAFPNGTFSSTYTNYRIILTTTALSTNLELRFRLRASGSDATGANYGGGGFYNYTSGATVAGLNFTGATYFTLGGVGTILNAAAPSRNFFVIDIGRPFAPSETMLNVHLGLQDTAGWRSTIQSFLHDGGTSYDSVNFITSTGTMTGAMSVYGYSI